MKCSYCGSEIPYETDRCPDCGESLRKPSAQPSGAGTKSAPSNADALTYNALGKSKKYYLSAGPRLWNLVKLGILLAAFLVVIVCLNNDSYTPLTAALNVVPFLALPLIFRIVHTITAFKSLSEKDYESAWHRAKKTTLLMTIGLMLTWICIMSESEENSLQIFGTVMFVIFELIVLFCMAHAGMARDLLNKIRLDEMEKLHAEEQGRYIEENDVQPLNKTANTLLALGAVGLLLLGAILIIMAENPAVTWLVILLYFGTIAFGIFWGFRRKSQWKKNDLWRVRQDKFYSYPTAFITQKTSFDRVIEEIKACDFAPSKTHWKTAHDGRIEFTGYGELFKGVLTEFAFDEPDKSKYVFDFKDLVRGRGIGYDLTALIMRLTGRDIARYADYMNLCLTQIEKAIKRIDENAEIRTGS